MISGHRPGPRRFHLDKAREHALKKGMSIEGIAHLVFCCNASGPRSPILPTTEFFSTKDFAVQWKRDWTLSETQQAFPGEALPYNNPSVVYEDPCCLRRRAFPARIPKEWR